jgi:hypothetical protein
VVKQAVAAALIHVVLLTGLPVPAQEHVVSIPDMEARLREVVADRAADVAELRSVLLSPAGTAAAARLGLDGRMIYGRLYALEDAELRDLARRAALMRTDPAATGVGKAIAVIALVILALCILLVLALLYADCGLDGSWCE